ncbi:hypothetical protein ACT8ZV_00130 [Nocardioides sp. MAHUQ-72]
MRTASSTGQRVWHTLTPEQKQDRLAELRRRQQLQVEVEARRLAALLD